ncbi:MAG: conjugal transfer protein TraF [Marinobacter sp.]|uniref:conjugal transfer protein TraF n=1 Tax=Marinobacter sp. TaxID=50741 RepID=UPI00299F065A|nr:conjugal transfer protein TraF [Marinobacter sp.]MDX1755472.1 conjugal transfer protein TraF [Marinobacter sp.]
MTGIRVSRLALAIGLTASTTTTVMAAPQTFQTARSFAMGGTGVAVAHPATANIANPAMLADDHHDWADDFGLILPSVNARFADEEEVVDQIDDIQDTIDRLANSDTPVEAQENAGVLRRQLDELDRDTARVDVGAGLSLSIPLETLSVGVFTDGSLRVTTRGNVTDNDLEILREIEEDVIAASEVATGVRDVESELTSDGTVIAASTAEIGVSFARGFELANGHSLSLGLSPKYVQLRTFEYVQRVGDFDDDDFDSDENETDDSQFNVDLGAAYRFGEDGEWNAGLSVRNLLPMDLESTSGAELEIDPRITAGIAHNGEYHVTTAELDLTEQKGFGFSDDTQWLAVGAEFDALRYAQLRVGLRHNLASNDDHRGVEEETQFTAGIGLSPFGARLDIGGLISDSEVGAAIELGAAF